MESWCYSDSLRLDLPGPDGRVSSSNYANLPANREFKEAIVYGESVPRRFTTLGIKNRRMYGHLQHDKVAIQNIQRRLLAINALTAPNLYSERIENRR